MALKIPLKSIYGIEANYWIVKDVLLDKSRRMARISMGGYPNQDIRNEDTDPLMKLKVDILFDKFDDAFSQEKMDTAGNNVYKLAYEAVKKHDKFFMEAEDLL